MSKTRFTVLTFVSLLENLTDIKYLYNGNYLVFTDIMPRPNLEDEISILKAENETLKQELSITQDAVNELIFNSLNI